MKYCQKCGKEIEDDAVICVHCGCQVEEIRVTEDVADVPSKGLNVLSFFIPIVGLILYLIWQEKTPIRAKKIGKSALIGFIVDMVLSITVRVLLQIAAREMGII